MRHVDKDKRVKARMPLRPSKDYEVQDKELTTEIIAGLYGKDQMKCLFETRKYNVLQMRHNISGVLDKLNNKCHDMWLHKEGHETWKGMNAYTNI